MANKKSIRILVVIFIILALQLTQTAYADSTATGADQSANQQYLNEVMNMVKDKYNGNVTDINLMQGLLKGMFGTMDPYTVFFTPAEGGSFLGEVSGTLQGIGVSLDKVGDYVTIMKVFPGSPAEQAGLTAGSKIVAVDGKSVIGSSLEEVAAVTRGESGTKVNLSIVKSGETAVTSIPVTRGPISINPVTYEIRGDVGYINISIFNSNTQTDLMLALNDMDKNNIKKIILDLRNNPGGEVGQAVEVAARFVPAGLITKLTYKSKDMPPQTFTAQQTFNSYKLVVLVNEMTASASEILAGAIQDRKAGVLVGTKTFGKGVVQDITPILTPDAYKKYSAKLGTKIIDANQLLGYGINPTKDDILGYAKITIGEYTTPNGRNIDKVGLAPDIAVDDYKTVNEVDVNSIDRLTKTSKFSLNDEGLDVYNAEKILKLCGYDVGTPTMKLDEKAVNAIKQVQQGTGLYPYGVLDLTTQQVLNDDLDFERLAIDKQYAKAVDILNKQN